MISLQPCDRRIDKPRGSQLNSHSWSIR